MHAQAIGRVQRVTVLVEDAFGCEKVQVNEMFENILLIFVGSSVQVR